MFNLIVKYNAWAQGRDTISHSRTFEHTEDRLAARFKPNGQLNLGALIELPTLFVQESSIMGTEAARVGTILRASVAGGDVILDYTYDLDIPPIPNSRIEALATDLAIDNFQLSRTHWSVKDIDLFRVLVRSLKTPRQRPRVFQIAEHEKIEPTLVSAMMPFNPSFDRVYESLQRVATTARMHCRRADDIWENPAVMQDVVSLIDRSSLVIADCTGRNPNVFYEIGIAHTLGREVVLITQNETDIPFDLRHLRYVTYLNNNEGLAALEQRIAARIEAIALLAR